MGGLPARLARVGVEEEPTAIFHCAVKSNMLFTRPAMPSNEPLHPLPAEPVVFDETDDGTLIRHRVIDEVLLWRKAR